jgi:hypothetical protein
MSEMTSSTVSPGNDIFASEYNDLRTDVINTQQGLSAKFSAWMDTGNDLNLTANVASSDIVFETELFDTGSNYNQSTGIFTAPYDGFYIVLASLDFGISSDQEAIETRVYKNSTITARSFGRSSGVGQINLTCNCLINLSATDTVSVRAIASDDDSVLSGNTRQSRFEMHLLST